MVDGNDGLNIRLYGTFEVTQNGEPITKWGRRKTQDLLKVLISERGRAFTADQLIDLLYPDTDPDKVLKNLRGRVSELRKALEPDLAKGPDSVYILSAGQGYVFSDVADCWLDVEVFEQHTSTADGLMNTERWAQAAEEYERAIEVYRGELLSEDAYEEWVFDLRDQWQRRYLNALENLARCRGHLGDFSNSIKICDQILDIEPQRESTFRIKMRHHYHAGEQSQALAVYDACVQSLKDQLGVEPSADTRRLGMQIRHQQVPELQAVTPNNLPVPLTQFIGRSEELSTIAERLQDAECRILSLVGPGGIGKTRLALQAATDQLEQFPDGVFWVSLASLTSDAHFFPAIAEALGFNFFGQEEPHVQLANYLREKQMLLILDNFEHLLDIAPRLSGIFQQASHLKGLVTSRSKLNVQGEWALPLQGFSLPGDDDEQLDQADAFKLFVNSARRVRPDFVLNVELKPEVHRVCKLVEGMPLGIELAAAWIEMLSCEEIANEIEKSVDFLASDHQDTPDRHRSLRATFDHSWSLLSEDERTIAQALSVFRGGFSREAADQVAGASLRQLAALVHKSFVKRTDAQRYEIHELLRQFAEERLNQDEVQEVQLRQAHSHYYGNFLAQRADWLKGKRQLQALNEISTELDNVRVMWEQAKTHQLWDVLSMSEETLFLFFETKGWFLEGETHFDNTVSYLKQVVDVPPDVLGAMMVRQAKLCSNLEKPDEAKALLAEAKTLIQDQSSRLFAYMKFVEGGLEEFLGEYGSAETKLQSALTLFQEMDDLYGQTVVSNNLGILGFDKGELDDAARHYEAALKLCQQSHDYYSLARVYNNLGNVYFFGKEDYVKAKAYYQKALPMFQEIGSLMGEQFALGNIGAAAAHLKELDEARVWFNRAIKVGRMVGAPSILIHALANISDVEYELGNHEAEFPYLQECYDIAVASGVQTLVMIACMFVARHVLKVDDTHRAARWLIFLHREHPQAYMQEYAKNLIEHFPDQMSQDEIQAAEAAVKGWAYDDFFTDMNQWMSLRASAAPAEPQ